VGSQRLQVGSAFSFQLFSFSAFASPCQLWSEDFTAIRPHFAQGTFKLNFRNMCSIMQTHPNLRLAAAVILAFAKVMQTFSFRHMGEMVKAASPAAQDDFAPARRTRKRPRGFLLAPRLYRLTIIFTNCP